MIIMTMSNVLNQVDAEAVGVCLRVYISQITVNNGNTVGCRYEYAKKVVEGSIRQMIRLRLRIFGKFNHNYWTVLKRCKPAPSSQGLSYHRSRQMRVDGVRLPRMHWWLARRAAMLILALTYPRTTEQGWSHFAAKWADIAFKSDFASLPKRPSTERTKGVKVRRCFKQLLTYLRFFSCSCFSSTSAGVSLKQEGLSVSVMRTSIMQSVPVAQTFLTRRSPLSSEGMLEVACLDCVGVEVVEVSSVFDCLVQFILGSANTVDFPRA